MLAEHPDQRREIVEDPSLVPNTIEEMLRFESPGPQIGRYMPEAVELYGETVPEGSCMLFLISAVGTGLANSVWLVVLFRIIGGIGVGVASVIAPMYIAETSPPRIRGRLGSLQQLAIVTGIFLSLAIDALLAHLAGGSREELWLGLAAWRWMFLIMAVPVS